MALVDASVGIKTGVNWGGKKNCIGTYSAPAAVLADVSWLRSLDMRNICNGEWRGGCRSDPFQCTITITITNCVLQAVHTHARQPAAVKLLPSVQQCVQN